jgi:hypothetical protein
MDYSKRLKEEVREFKGILKNFDGSDNDNDRLLSLVFGFNCALSDGLCDELKPLADISLYKRVMELIETYKESANCLYGAREVLAVAYTLKHGSGPYFDYVTDIDLGYSEGDEEPDKETAYGLTIWGKNNIAFQNLHKALGFKTPLKEFADSIRKANFTKMYASETKNRVLYLIKSIYQRSGTNKKQWYEKAVKSCVDKHGNHMEPHDLKSVRPKFTKELKKKVDAIFKGMDLTIFNEEKQVIINQE